MAMNLQQIWKFLNNNIRELGNQGEIIEAGTDFTKFALEFAIALGLLSASPTGIFVAGLSGVRPVVRSMRLYHQKTNNAMTLEGWVAIASPLAYLESLNELVQSNELLQQISIKPVSEKVKQRSEKLREFSLDNELAKNALRCFHESELAQLLNQILSAQLQEAGIGKHEAESLTAWVAWGTQEHMKKALEDAGELRNQAELYISGRRKETDKYESIDSYLKEWIATKPEEKVFAENFNFKDIYVPLKAQMVDANGETVKNKASHVNLEEWAKDTLLDIQKQDRVMFIQGGPGRGKSVFCRMFADFVRQHFHPIWTPILIRLRDIRTFENSFTKTLQSAVKADFAATDDGWLTDRSTRFLFLLDGFDELLMQGRSSGGLEQFMKQVGGFQRDCQQSHEMGHRVLITGRSLALQNIERLMPENLERVEILPMSAELQQQWFSKWSAQVGTDKTSAFQQFLQDSRCPERVQELAQEPLLLYLLAAMHRDGELTIEMFEGASGTKAKILFYQKSLDWVLTKQRPEFLNRELTEQNTDDLRRILTEAGLCVVQSGGECASVAMIEERLKGDDSAKALLEKAQKRIGDNLLRNALAAFYLQPAASSKEGAVEFAHKSFGEFLYAERLKESLEDWTQPGKKGREFNIEPLQMDWEIYDLLGYGGLTPEIVEYLMALLDQSHEFQPLELFNHLEDFYMRWCDGEFIDALPDNYPQKKMSQLQGQKISTGVRQVDVYAGLNVMILLLELNRYAQSKDDLKDKIKFYPAGQEGTGDRLLRIVGYRCSVDVGAFIRIIRFFLRGANLRGADLRGADLSDADLSDADLSGANLRGADLSDANLRGADLSDAYLSGADLSGADLSDAYLSGADLSDADLSGADLSGADLSGTYLSGADFSDADLSGADLSDAYLSGADLSDAYLSGADLSDAYLNDADLSDADLSGAELSDAYLNDAYLRRANISWDETPR